MLKYQNAEHSNGNYSVRASSAQGVDTNPLQSLSSVTSYCLLFNVLSPVSGKVLGGKQQKLNGADLCKKVTYEKDAGQNASGNQVQKLLA